jgi:hypothetical protein
MNSRLYACSVMHHRLVPRKHAFRYRIFLFALDLDEIDEVAARVRGFSRNRFNLYTFRDSDHLEPTAESVKEKFLRELEHGGVEFPEGGRILLLTMPRMLGYVFNPVSFYFCADAKGNPFAALAEVSNTFREMKLFLIPRPDSDGVFRLIAPKHFYVSPFSMPDLAFDFRLRMPGDTLEIHIDDLEGERRTLLSAVTGHRKALTSASLALLTLIHPLVTLRVMFLIHWNALLLWLKRIPWFAKTDHRDLQRDVLRPHRSLTNHTR